jgi:DNA polymerase-3 subunit delta
MIIVAYGDDTFRVKEKIAELQAAFLKKFDPTGLNLSVFRDATGKLDLGAVMQAAGSLPFLSAKRMVIVRDLIATTKKDGESAWTELFGRVPDSTILVLWETAEPKTLKKKSLYKSLVGLAEVHVYPFPALEGAALQKWTAERVKMLGGEILPDALRELCDRVGPDLWQMSNEIAKLVSTQKQIDKRLVVEVVRASFEGDVFAFVDAVSRKDPNAVTRFLTNEREAGASDFQLLAMLARQIRILLAARWLLDHTSRATHTDLAREFDIHPFVAQKAFVHARAYTFDVLRNAHEMIFRLDEGSKNGYVDAELAVNLVTHSLVSS